MYGSSFRMRPKAGMAAQVDIPAVLECYGESKQIFMGRVHEFCDVDISNVA